MMHRSDSSSSVKYSVSKVIVSLICLYVLFFSLWPFFIDIRITEKVGINPERVLLALIVLISLLAYLSGGVNAQRLSVLKKNKIVAYSITAFFIWRFMAVVFVGGMESFPYWIYEFLSNYVLFIVVLLFVDSHRARKKVLGWLSISDFFVLCIAIFEFMKGEFLFTPFVTGESRAALGAISGSFRNNLYRVQGTFEHALVLSQYLLILLPIVLLYINYYFRTATSVRLIFSSAAVFLTLIVLLMAQCRTSLVTIFAWLVYWIYKKIKVGRQRYLVLLGAIGFAFMAYNLYLSGSEVAYSDARYAQVINGILAIQESPLFGYGPGISLGEILFDVGESVSGSVFIYEENASTIDNRYLSVVLESGVPSLVLFFVFLWKIFSTISFKVVQYGELKRELSYFALSIIACGVTMLTLSIYTVMPVMFLIFAIAYCRACGVD